MACTWLSLHRMISPYDGWCDLPGSKLLAHQTPLHVSGNCSALVTAGPSLDSVLRLCLDVQVTDQACACCAALYPCPFFVPAGYGVQALSTGEGALGSLAKFGESF
jgi:hypothetical protein